MLPRDPYTDALLSAADSMHATFDAYCNVLMSAANNEWTEAFLRRMVAHDRLNRMAKMFANKRVSGALDDAMVETLAMLLRAHLHVADRSDLSVEAERTIPKKGLRPDLSVWQSGVPAPVAIIEAKVQMGWGRGNVSETFLRREEDLVAAGVPAGNIWHVVGTQSNWSRDGNPNWGGKWRVVVEGPWSGKRLHPIDPIFSAIANLPRREGTAE
jgi:hypothetical protein